MTAFHTAPARLTLTLSLLLTPGLGAWAQSAETHPTPPALAASPADAPPAPIPAPAVDTCRPLTDQAMAADMKAVTARSQKLALAEQAPLFEAAVSLWSQAMMQCEGRAKDRAQRNLADSQRTHASISEQLDAGPQCVAAHKDAGTLQELARQALSERRWVESAVLFRKAENMWDIASERCTGSQQDTANRRREQSEIDGHNAEFCAPLFEQARDSTQKLRASAAGLSKEARQEASQATETLWRNAADQCKGSAVQDSARNNAQALARERGSPLLGRLSAAPTPAAGTPVATPTAALQQTRGGAGGAPSAPAPQASASPSADTPAGEFSAGSTRLSGQFVRDPDGTTFSGQGKMVWANGDVFVGTLVKGQRHGQGKIVWANGQSYDGDWVQDQPQGHARLQFANGNRYEGAVLAGLPQGQGRMQYASGDAYTGQFKNGDPDGRGLYVWKNTQQFNGDWQQGRPNGQGQLKFANGNVFDGPVVNGTPQGQGRLQFPSGDTYVGHLVNGLPDGTGTFTWAQGDTYSGQWKAGQKQGQGRFTWKNGESREGLYDQDQPVAPAAN